MSAQNPAMDRHLQMILSEDRMLARLSLKQLDERVDLTVDQLVQFIQDQGVTLGIQHEMLERIVNRELKQIGMEPVVAIGLKPKKGEDGKIRLIESASSMETRPTERDDGTIDHKQLIQLSNIKAGQMIAEKVSPGKGTPGMTVTGEFVPPKEGKPAHFKIGKNVVTNAEQTALYATIDGMLSITDKNKMNVFPIFEVNGDVDYKIGNIDFVGTVIIRGNVLNGFKVKASGDIRIIGGIEAAEVVSDGSIEVSGGIIGSGKGLVKAGHHVKCAFVQEANIVAGADVYVTQSIMHANVCAGRLIQCLGSKGLIVGGLLQAGERVVGRMIGNAMSTPTVIEVGVHPEYRQELITLRSEIKKYKESLDKAGKALALLDQLAANGQLATEKLAMRIKLGSTKRQHTEELDRLKERVLEIERSLEDISTARVDVEHTMYGGLKIVIGRYTRFIKESVQRVSIRFSDGDIAMIPYY